MPTESKFQVMFNQEERALLDTRTLEELEAEFIRLILSTEEPMIM